GDVAIQAACGEMCTAPTVEREVRGQVAPSFAHILAGQVLRAHPVGVDDLVYALLAIEFGQAGEEAYPEAVELGVRLHFFRAHAAGGSQGAAGVHAPFGLVPAVFAVPVIGGESAPAGVEPYRELAVHEDLRDPVDDVEHAHLFQVERCIEKRHSANILRFD